MAKFIEMTQIVTVGKDHEIVVFVSPDAVTSVREHFGQPQSRALLKMGDGEEITVQGAARDIVKKLA